MQTTAIGPQAASAGYRQVLGEREGIAIFGAHGISMLGTVAGQAALAVLVYERTGSPLLSALTLAFAFVPYLFAGIVVSAVADRYRSRQVLVSCDLLSAGLVALTALPGLPVAGILALVLAMGSVGPVFAGTRAATLADVYDGDRFVTARSILRITSQTALVVGFAASGVLLTVVSPSTLLLADAMTFLVSAVVLRWFTSDRAPRGGGEAGASLLRDSLRGAAVAVRTPAVRAALLLAWLPVGFAATADGLAPAYADHIGAHGGSAVGLMFAAYAAGTVAGEVVLTRLATTTKDRLMLPLATGCQLALVCFALRPGLPAALGLLILMGIGTAYAQPLDRQLLSATPEAMRGRVLTLHSAGLMFTQGAFIAAAGAAAEGVEPWAVLTAAGVLGVLTVSILGGTLRRNGAAARG